MDVTLFVQTLIFGLLIGGVYALVSSGFTLTFGVMRVLNLAHPAMIVLAAFGAWTLWDRFGIDPLLAGVVLTPVMYVVGWALYVGVVRRMERIDHELTLVATFGVAIALGGVMSLIWSTELKLATPGYYASSFRVGDIVVPKAQLYACVGAVLILFGLYIVMTRTFVGRAIRACSMQSTSAALVGIDVDRTRAHMFAIGSATTAFAGGALAVLYQFVPDSHFVWIGRILCVVILGGLGSYFGALLGAVVLGLGESLTAAYIDTRWATAVPYLLIVAILVLRPQGLAGSLGRADGVAP